MGIYNTYWIGSPLYYESNQYTYLEVFFYGNGPVFMAIPRRY